MNRMPALKPKTKRQQKFYEISCPVKAELRDRPNGKGMEEGQLRRIGVRSARCYFTRPITTKTHVALHVYFPHPGGRPTIVVFDAVVIRVGKLPPYATTLRFRGGARFLRNQLGDLLGDYTA
jgi:hypothetical protein